MNSEPLKQRFKQMAKPKNEKLSLILPAVTSIKKTKCLF